jgi:beta-glucanase (GH16 family)
MEFVGYDPGVIHANVHTRDHNHTKRTGRGDKIEVPDASDVFHTYAVEWTETEMRFFVDGDCYFTCKNDGKGIGSWPFDAPQYLILNLAVGGAWGGQKGIDDSIFPQRMVIDHVRVYRRKD